MNFNVCSFNVRGINSDIEKDNLVSDLIKYKADVICFQETKLANGVDVNIRGQRLLCFKSDSRHCGSGFLLSKLWSDKIHRTWKVTDRICVLQLKINEVYKNKEITKLVTIINVYAVYGPTSQRAERDPDESDSFYRKLDETINSVRRSSILILARDFYAKVGHKQQIDYTCIGNYSKGKRNHNDEKLLEFCEVRGLFISNSAFNHPSRHTTTWKGHIRGKENESTIRIFNQIDYIICEKRHKNLLTNARSYAGTLTNSDHRLVKTTFRVEKHKLWNTKSNTPKPPKLNISKLTNSKTCRDQYRITWANIRSAIKNSAKASVGTIVRNKQKRTPNDTISDLS